MTARGGGGGADGGRGAAAGSLHPLSDDAVASEAGGARGRRKRNEAGLLFGWFLEELPDVFHDAVLRCWTPQTAP